MKKILLVISFFLLCVCQSFAVQVLCIPNPFSPNGDGVRDRTTFNYTLTQAADIHLSIYSLSGEKIWDRRFVSGQLGAQTSMNAVEWGGQSDFGETLANGVYLIRITDANHKLQGKAKVLIIK